MKVKPWQIFVFSLVPLALAFAGVIGGSFHGSDSAKEYFAPAPTPRPGGFAPAHQGFDPMAARLVEPIPDGGTRAPALRREWRILEVPVASARTLTPVLPAVEPPFGDG